MSTVQDIPQRKIGIIRRYFEDRDFGFIEADGVQYFFHTSEFDQTGLAMGQTREKVTVEFEPDPESPKGPRASKVRVATKYGNDLSHFMDLRVSSQTAVKSLAGSIVASVMQDRTVRLMAIGHGAVAQAVKAVNIASTRTYGNGFVLAILPSFETRNIQQKVEEGEPPEEVERTLTVLQLVKHRPL
jgi:stage V sporulation protein SpoVS/cold shock CspA family protein